MGASGEFGCVLPRSFYERETVAVARDLLGRVLVHGPLAGRIVETEAYAGEHDAAAHAAAGRTPRTAVLYGPPGHAYVYFIYGRYECLNLVAEPEHTPGCVLIRALEPLAGVEQMRRHRRVDAPTAIASGPGKLTIAMNITRRLNGADVTRGPLTVRAGSGPEPAVLVGPRVGITKAADWPLRFAIAGSPYVSRPRRTLRPLEP